MNLLFVPPSIGEMPRLERLHLQQDYSEGMVVIELPRGPWLRSVRWLGLPWECLDDPDNLEVLRSTAQLEFLCALTLPCIGDREDSFDHWDAFFEWVATHPPLRCFGFEPGDVAEVKTALLNAVLNMVQRRPHLILRHVDYDSPGFLLEMLNCEDIPTKPTPFGGW
ncbi:hypothetical protein COHA_003947 [Chlorella ohadii]|uniref:Uncharacterized protein n=1 Tax=Chlorella ohadii TaxID=2649997 RepID=A0AAD5DRB2_9CHLO|nr:hypothetical protein COHA_003947 [Chlorella ohadii]